MQRFVLALWGTLAFAWAQPFSDVRPLEGRALENVTAFSRLLGYVRYFHPSDAAYTTDWESFAVAKVESVEGARNARELAGRLEQLFLPYAPTLRVFSTAEPVAAPPPAVPVGVQPLYVTTLARTILGESDTLLLRRADRISVPVQNRQLPRSFEYANAGLLRFPQPQTLPLPDPAQPYLAELGGGVSAAVPLAVYATQTATLPRIPIPPRTQLPPQAVASSPDSVRNRANRLALVAVAWNAYQHLFAYWDQVPEAEAAWAAALPEALRQAAVAANEPAFTAVLQRMAAGLRDGHNFIERSGRSGYGSHTVPFTMDLVEGRLVVTTVLDPDFRGLRVGDVVTGLDGRPALETLAASAGRISGSEPYRRYLGLALLSGGGPGSTLAVEAERGGQRLRLEVPRSFAKERSLPPHEREPRPPAVAQLAPGVMYLDLTRLEVAQFEAALPALSTASGLVLDVRGYVGDAALRVLAHLTERPLEGPPIAIPIVTRPDHQDIRYLSLRNVWVQPQRPLLTAKVAVIANANGTISFSESVLGMVQGHRLGRLVGLPSAGANGNVVNLILPGRYITRWTGLKVTNFDGSPMFAVGIKPDVAVERTLAGVAAGRDELLEAAFTAVTGRAAGEMRALALNGR
ncbi:MAG: S41 family peptidase [Meiothermus sp.]|nr:S41 family peptidase [Meiothermus sp.]